MIRVHCLQHASYERMAIIEDFLKSHNFPISHSKLYLNEQLPDPNQLDCLFIMGGPMSVNDHDLYPWLIHEKQFILSCIQAGKIVIGICLGSQLIANSLGASVYPNVSNEIGWFPLHRNKNIPSSIMIELPDNLNVFHFHGDTFDLPSGAKLIASSDATPHQIFLLGDRILGIQCHLELDFRTFSDFIIQNQSVIIPSSYVQSESVMIDLEKQYRLTMNTILRSILSKMLIEGTSHWFYG